MTSSLKLLGFAALIAAITFSVWYLIEIQVLDLNELKVFFDGSI